MQKSIIVDFDNTMGVPNCDIDDGLALLYLLGQPEKVRILGMCSTYGNSTLDTVHKNTERLIDVWGLDIPLYRGAQNAHEPLSEAAHFLAETAAAHPQEVYVVATGSLTNLKGAALIDPQFFSNLAGIYLMGGITHTLLVNGTQMDELNFACDAQATALVLNAPCPVTVATAQNCLDARFNEAGLREAFGESSWMMKTCEPWFEAMQTWYGCPWFVCWDVVTAAMLVQPELFCDQAMPVTLNERLLSLGYLEQACENDRSARIHVPTILDASSFCQEMLSAWKRGLTHTL